ncbi:hypothetical protein DH2020_027514 [Rehmannia glutinosa]|uniref:Non-haem dioxygenase N-terminal domain-containing protein n=1 Tax=Rehmannia glutinosa TaxID=99300 RepID=A0ABR0VVU1_REHGL
MAGETDVYVDDQQRGRIEMLKAFDETKAGVKGIIDSGLLKVPKIFVRPSEELTQELTYKNTTQIQVPVIDLSDIQINADRRKRIVEQVRIASETWGFFQVVNHGISSTVLDAMIDGVRKFNEQDVEEKKKYYSRDIKRRVRFNSNYDLFSSKSVNWRDTLAISFSDQINSEEEKELPDSCRESAVEYSKHVTVLGSTLLELLSEALGLKPNHLYDMECSKGHRLGCHYYPACPEPELTLEPPSTLILDFLQFFYKTKSVASRFCIKANGEVKVYGPIKELISEENPAKYKEFLLTDYIMKFLNTGLDEYLGLDYYKL